MNKERSGAFMDAVIAIVMTILVLELEKPAEPTLEAFWDLRVNFAAYAITFLWLASMWSCLHNAWHVVDKVSGRTIWLSIGLLFFSSLFPYATSLLADYFDSGVVQGFYALIVIATMIMLYLIHKSLAKDDGRPETVAYMNHICNLMMVSVGMMIVGAVLGMFVWTPLVTIGLLAAAVILTTRRKLKGTHEPSSEEEASAEGSSSEEGDSSANG